MLYTYIHLQHNQHNYKKYKTNIVVLKIVSREYIHTYIHT